MKRLMTMLAVGVMATALIACDSSNGDSNDPDNPAPVGTSTPADGTPVDPAPTGPTGATGPDATPTEPEFETVEELAPIEEMEVLFLESDPVQHNLFILSGLPSGCAAFNRIEMQRDDTTFTIEVINNMPAPDEDVACTMIYGYHQSTVDLGNDLDAGTEYTVNVNGETMTFVAQ